MMYNQKMAIAIKNNGKVLREFGETVYVPFGSEYSIFIKNLNSVRALVTVEIDGTDVGDGQKFVIGPNSETEITRFIKDGNLQQGNRFKFIERTGAIEDHRGIGAEDGLVRVSFQYERVVQPFIAPVFTTYPTYVHYDYRLPVWTTTTISTSNGMDGAVGGIVNSSTKGMRSANAAFSSTSLGGSVGSSITTTSASNAGYSIAQQQVNDAGITVAGSVSEQKFTEVSGFPVESTTHVTILKLVGQTETNRVQQAVTVKAKPKCTTCGKVNKATAKFCTECGTSLVII